MAHLLASRPEEASMTRRFHAAVAGIGLLALTSAASHTPAKEAVPFIENDYPKALAQARARHVPIFADAWAPW
jgi:hypothetical protein